MAIPDYPAAHSMDSTWFAVDEDGTVAYFDTGEGGCIPDGDFPMGGEAGGYSKRSLQATDLLAHVLWAMAGEDQRMREILPESVAALERALADSDDCWEEVAILLRSTGVFTYVCDDAIALPYQREGRTPDPLPLSALDEETRQRFANARLPVRFADQAELAPGEYGGVHAWSAIWVDTRGQAHPTLDSPGDYEAELADWREYEESYHREHLDPEDAPLYQGDALYERIREILASSPPPAGGGTEGKSWLRRLFGR